MPMVICVFVLLIYFSYYMYGRCILSQDCYILAFRASRATLEYKDDPAGFVEYKAADQAGKKYFGTSKPSFTGSLSGKDFYVKGNIDVKHGAMGTYFLKPQDGWDVEATLKARKREYTKHIRLFTRLRDLGKSVLESD